MKLTKITSMALALIVTAVLGTAAQAQLTYNEGDLFLGFEQQNGASTNNYVIDLGSVSQFLNATPGSPLTFNLSTSDLNTAFTSSWASNSQTNLVQWGVVGASDESSSLTLGGNTLAKNTLFYTQGELNVGTQSTPPKDLNNAGQQGINDNILAFENDFEGQTASTGSTPSLQATIESASDPNGWSANEPQTGTSGAFGSGKNIEQPLSGSFTGPTDSTLDLYELVPHSPQGVTPAQFLGAFTLSESGNATTLTYDASSVPEPSTYAMLLFGLVGLWAWRRRLNLASQI